MTRHSHSHWIATGKYDGSPVRVTIWREDQAKFTQAGYAGINWLDNGVDGQAVNIEVILDWKQSCGYVVREVPSKEVVSV
jgi:hypothetical protein